MEPPLGFITLRDAADIVGHKMYESWLPLSWTDGKVDNVDAHVRDWRAFTVALQLDPKIDRVIKALAEWCEAGEIAAAYRSYIGGADALDCSVWRLSYWRNYFSRETIDLDLPLIDANGRPDTNGYTARCTREIFVRRQDLDRLVGSLPSSKTPKAKARGIKACTEWLVELRNKGPQANPKARYKDEAIERFGVGPDQFERVWNEAASTVPNANWGKPGRRPKATS